MDDKIYIHKTNEKYEKAISNFKLDENVNVRNKDLILKFIWDCRIGKTLKGRSKKKIGKGRIIQYIYNLRILSRWLGKAFDQVTQEEMERFIADIDDNVFKKGEKNYAEGTKLELKKTLAKFYKWLGHFELVAFMDTSSVMTDVPAITRQEAERLVNSTPEMSLKAAITVLFDGGLRAEEFLNLRIKDLTKTKYREDNNCYFVNIRHSKTFARTIPLPLSMKYLEEWLAEHPEKHNPEAQVFPFTYKALLEKIKVLGKKVLKRNITLHMLRHSSATYWAPKMNRYQFCAKYGWSFGSNMPDRYIKRKGIIFDEIAEKGDVDKTSKLEKENILLKEKIESLDQEHKKFRKVLEFIMPVIMEKIDDRDFKEMLVKKRKEQLVLRQEEEGSNGSEFRLML